MMTLLGSINCRLKEILFIQLNLRFYSFLILYLSFLLKKLIKD